MEDREQYPLILFPWFYDGGEKLLDLKRHIIPENSGAYIPPKGISELKFLAQLTKNGNYTVHDSTRFYHGKIANSAYERFLRTGVQEPYSEDKKDCYYPDILLIDKEHRVVIDIEIDEPYAADNGMPTHHLDFDDEFNPERDRNNYFAERGIAVVRFAEEQIVKYPNGCIDLINALVEQLASSDMSKVDSYSFIFPDTHWKIEMHVDRWYYSGAEAMAVEHYREKYLNIQPFIYNVEGEEIDVEPAEDPIARAKRLRIEATRSIWLEAKKQKEEYAGNDKVMVLKLEYQETKTYLDYSNEINISVQY